MRWEDRLSDLDLVFLVRAFYLSSALVILSVRLVPPLQHRFLDYGARQTARKMDSSSNVSPPLLARIFDIVAQVKVSHTRFSDFYILSLLCLAFWVSQISTDGAIITRLGMSAHDTDHESTAAYRTGLGFLLFTIQSLRRLYECLSLSNGPSSSTMWIGHYLIGLSFYFFTNIALFIEHVPASPHASRFKSLPFPANALKALIDLLALSTFLAASVQQHIYHAHLASLKKYTLPSHGAFKYIVAPHYTAECLIYLSLSFLIASTAQLVNKTMLCAFIFVVVNLGVTVEGTKRWMLGKFPESRADVEGRWRMIPVMF